MATDVILTDTPEPHLLVITINRFERRNAFDGATARAMEAAIDAYEDDTDLRCAIITGAVGGGLFRLPKRIPYHVAMELALTGKARPAPEFYRLGLVNRLAEPGHALEGAIELARDVLKAGPLAVIASKQIVQRSYDWADN